MQFLTQTEGLSLLAIFGITMIGLVWFRTKASKHAEGFLVADRNVGPWKAGLSLAISWAWAPAFFMCSLMSFSNGLAGAFWFIAPNILTFFIFIPFALKIRKEMPKGYTLPEYIYDRFGGNKAIHIVFVVAFLLSMLVAFVANTTAGGILLHTLSGIDRDIAVIAMVLIALTYSLFSGLKASIITDLIQIAMVFVFILIIMPWVIIELGGFSYIIDNLSGISGEYGFFLHPAIAFTMGIPTSIVLITGPLCDQMFIQRIFAVQQKEIPKTLAIAGLSFGIIPITLSLLGFIAVGLVQDGSIIVDNPEMVGPTVIGHLLPDYALWGFTFMAFAGLCSTIDSALCAISSIGAVDIYKRYFVHDAIDQRLLRASRIIMIIMAIFGLIISFSQPNILWVFMIGGSVTASTFFPVILALFWKRLPAYGVFLSVILSLAIGLPYSIYANYSEATEHIVYASMVSVFIPLLICGVTGLMNRKTG